MNPWSLAFAAHLAARGLSQIGVAVELQKRGLRVTQSQVHYWCRGSVPRGTAIRREVERWSGGAVPATLAAAGAASDGDDGRVRTGTDG